MPYYIDDNCVKCGKCAKICPVSCIKKGAQKYVIDETACKSCGKCKKVCSHKAISKLDKKTKHDDVVTDTNGNNEGKKLEKNSCEFINLLDTMDKNLLKALETIIHGKVTVKKLSKLEKLDLSLGSARNSQETHEIILNLSGIEICEDLKFIKLDGNGVSDLAPLDKLERLKKISLAGNCVKDVACLANAENLKKLNLEDNTFLEEISPLKDLKKLKYLNISGTKVKDITYLRELPKLEELELFNMTELELSEGSKNYEALVAMIIRGVNVKIEEIDKYKSTADLRIKDKSK